jgi:hypothetical protein
VGGYAATNGRGGGGAGDGSVGGSGAVIVRYYA